MSSRVVTVTGAGGFIGGNLTRHLRRNGWTVRGLVHSRPAEPVPGVEYFPYEMAAPLPQDALGEGGFLVHCAYSSRSRGEDAARRDVAGSRTLFGLCARRGVRPVFLSSFSAHPGAVSRYGRTKLEIEGLLDPAASLVLRPGLVVGTGGLFWTIAGKIRTGTIIPLVGGGRQPVQTIAIGDLCRLIEAGLERDIRGICRLADPAVVTLGDLCGRIARRYGRKVRFLPIPARPAYLACRAAEALGIGLPVSSDSILGLSRLQAFETTPDLGKFGVDLTPLDESLRDLP